ncbi:uncharacterized protein LOC121734903 [Aricia agestis]|uniref:uncharacterized protein LOC121734903 n=1 Tax=Aricia agestis TaxID=91739 RepID=UPI001C205A3A|nr:uncharacterized protein LOC121734903 [Aricia agestis]
MVSRILCLTMVFGMALGATFIGRPPVKPQELSHKEGCYVSEINDVLPFGEEITPPGQCYRIECDKGILSYASCGYVYTEDPNCYITKGDLRRPYPDCCPDVRCEIENSILFY